MAPNKFTEVKQFLKIDSPIRFLSSNTDTQEIRLIGLINCKPSLRMSFVYLQNKSCSACMMNSAVIPQNTEGNNSSLYE